MPIYSEGKPIRKHPEGTRSAFNEGGIPQFSERYAPNVPVQKKGNNTGLPDSLKSGIENLSRQSMDDVQVHYNSDKPKQLNAHAYAQGTNIHLAPGQEKHLPHEAWHVVQQKQGRVKPTMQLKTAGVSVNNDVGLEKEADMMGSQAVSVGNNPFQRQEVGDVDGQEGETRINGVVQRMEISDIKVGQWYSIEHITQPLYLKTKRTPSGSSPSWYFYTTTAGERKGEIPFIVSDPNLIKNITAKPEEKTELNEREFNQSVAFGLDGKNEDTINTALDAGYTRFDMAENYGNTLVFAKLLARRGIDKDSLFFIYKFNIPPDTAPENVKHAVDDKLLGVLAAFGHLDVVMLHNMLYKKTVLGEIVTRLSELKAEGRILKIGLSNVSSHQGAYHQLNKKKEDLEAPYDQIDAIENNASVFDEEQSVKDLATRLGLEYYGYSVLNKSLINHPDIIELATKLHLTPAQLLIEYAMSRGTIPIVSSTRKPGLDENRIKGKLSGGQIVFINSLIRHINEEYKASEEKVKLTESDTSRQVGLLMNIVYGGELKEDQIPRYKVKLNVFMQNANFKEFAKMVVPNHSAMDKKYLHNELGNLLETFPLNSCDCGTKYLTILNAARFFEAKYGKPIVSSIIMEPPVSSGTTITIDLDDED